MSRTIGPWWVTVSRRIITAIRCGHNIQDLKDSIHSFNLSELPRSEIQELLCEAIRNHSKEILKLLIISSAKVNIESNKHYTVPLHLAAEQGDAEIVEMLLDRGANLNDEDKNGRTPLHNAACFGTTEIIQMLLDRGADINAKDKNGWTPLQCATQQNNTENRRFLSHYVTKMKIAGLYVNDENLNYIDTNFCNMCETEIEAMKNKTVGDSYVSFYDILKKSSNRLAMFLRNECILQVLESGDYRTRFPTYGCMLNKQFISGKRRKEFLERGANVFHSNVKRIPDHCIDDIFSYLSDEDINALIQTGKRKRSDDL